MQEGCTDGYDLLKTNREVLVDGLGYFIIDDVSSEDIDVDGHGSKTIGAKSVQYELSSKIVDYINDVLPFYDSTGTSDKISFMELMLEYMPGWTFSCDIELEARYRSIEITKQTALDVLYSTASEAYQCIFDFDFLTRHIHATAISTLTKDGNPVKKTDIYLSFDNVMNGLSLKENSDNVKTKLYVYGQDLDIRQVNPLGTAYIVNLDYFKTPEWMDETLIEAVDSWEEKVENIKQDYAGYLSGLSSLRRDLTALEADLVTLEGKKAEYDNIISAKIEGGYTSGQYTKEYRDAVASAASFANQISAKKTEIEMKETEIAAAIDRIKSVNRACALESNFTDEQLLRLSRFLKESEYANNNYVVTDLMTEADIQEEAEELYREGEYVLSQLSQPSFTLSVDAKAFIHMPEFVTFTEQLELGCMVTVEKSEDIVYIPILLEMEFSWDDKEDFSLQFGNRFHLDDAGFTYESLLGSVANTSSSVSANWDSIVDFNRNYKDSISNLINNAFNVALHNIVSSANQDIIWDASGFTCRKWNGSTGTYENEQFKIINNMIAFTDDGWNSLKTVIGKIALENGGSKYGVAAEVIVGKLLAGNNLVITNEKNTFRIDENGVSFLVADDNGNETFKDLAEYVEEQVGSIGSLDSKISSYYQEAPPYGAAMNVKPYSEKYSECEALEGDLWYSPDTLQTRRYTKKYNTATDTYSFTWEIMESSVPSELWDAVDGKRTIYLECPVNGFRKGDLWVYKSAPMGYTAPYDASGKQFEINDLLVATEDSDTYKPSLWEKYNPNIDKGSGSFEFHLNDKGMTIKNGDIMMETGSNTVTINPTDGIQICSGTEKKFYADQDGNLHLAGILEAATGKFSGEITGGSIDIGKGTFKVDKYGNLTAKSGIFKGTVQADKYLDADGEEMMSLGKFKGQYLDLRGLTITNNDGDVTFRIDENGNVSVQGDIVVGEDSYITWEDIEADEDGIISDKAAALVEDLAAGRYTASGNTFINGKNIYSPNIFANHFGIYPDDETDLTGGLSIYGMWCGERIEICSITYSGQDMLAPYVVFGSENNAYAMWNFPHTSILGNIDISSDTEITFNTGSVVDFTNAEVIGLGEVKVVAVFG